jgi:hypothetical protein
MKNKMLKTYIFIATFLLVHYFAHGATYYVDGNAANDSGSGLQNSPKKYVKSGVDLLSAGDTLVIKDGTYSGSRNMLNYCEGDAIWHTGRADAWITIRAEHDGEVVLDGQGTDSPLCIKGDDFVDDTQGSYVAARYFEFRGLISRNSKDNGVSISQADNIRLINMGAVDPADGNTSGIWINHSTQVLVEGCYAWGAGRYKISTWHTDHTVFRNCLARMDRVNAMNDPSAVYSIYSSTNIEVQNCIAIDGDQPQYWLNVNEYAGAFAVPATSFTNLTGPVNFTNVIAMNNKTRFAAVADNSYLPDVHFRECVGVDHVTRGANDLIHGRGNILLNQCTFANVDNEDHGVYAGAYFLSWPGPPHNSNGATNSIWYNFYNGGLFYDNAISDYNNVFNVDGEIDVYNTVSTNTRTLNPAANGLLYPTRIEGGSVLATAGKNGARIGANIVKQYGKTGTMFGEAGYNLLQDGTNGQADVNLWPFPNETLIKAKMAAYSHDNGNLTGNRGFASLTARQLDGVTPVTLTSYIWESLGSRIPPEIYAGYCSYDDVTIAGTSDYYPTIQQAYDECSDGDTVQLHGVEFAKDRDLEFSQPVAVSLQGGFACDYLSNPGFTTIAGTMTINKGTVTLERIILR